MFTICNPNANRASYFLLILLSHIDGDVPTTGVKFSWHVLDGSRVGWN